MGSHYCFEPFYLSPKPPDETPLDVAPRRLPQTCTLKIYPDLAALAFLAAICASAMELVFNPVTKR